MKLCIFIFFILGVLVGLAEKSDPFRDVQSGDWIPAGNGLWKVSRLKRPLFRFDFDPRENLAKLCERT